MLISVTRQRQCSLNCCLVFRHISGQKSVKPLQSLSVGKTRLLQYFTLSEVQKSSSYFLMAIVWVFGCNTWWQDTQPQTKLREFTFIRGSPYASPSHSCGFSLPHCNLLREADIMISILQMRKTETQTGGLTCSKPHSKQIPESGFKFRCVRIWSLFSFSRTKSLTYTVNVNRLDFGSNFSPFSLALYFCFSLSLSCLSHTFDKSVIKAHTSPATWSPAPVQCRCPSPRRPHEHICNCPGSQFTWLARLITL